MVVEDIPKLYTALAEWLPCVLILLTHKKHLANQRVLRTGIAFAVSLAMLCAIQLFCGTVSGILWLLGMLVAIAVMIATIKISLDIPCIEALYYTAGAFMWAEFVASLEWQLETYYAHRLSDPLLFCRLIFLFIYTAVFWVFYLCERLVWRDFFEKYFISISAGDIFRVWISVLVFFSLSNLSYVRIDSPFSGASLTEISISELL